METYCLFFNAIYINVLYKS